MTVGSTLVSGLCLVALVTGSEQVGGRLGPSRVDAAGSSARCKVVTKKVHGHRKKVRVCARVRPTPTAIPRLFDGPSDAAVDAHGDILIADQHHRRIATLSPSGALLTSWTTAGSDPATFDTLYGIALDRAGNVYVTDAANHLVDKLDSTGKPIARWSTERAEAGSFPTLLAVADNGDVFVSDHTAEAVLHFSPDGVLLAKIGQHAFTDPYGVAIGPNGSLYVADFGAARVREYSPGGQAVATWGDGVGGTVHFDAPEGIALDHEGNIVVTEQSGNIVKFDQSGKVVKDFGSTGALQLDDPSGIALDGQDNMYVTEFLGNRLDKISPSGAVLASWK